MFLMFKLCPFQLKLQKNKSTTTKAQSLMYLILLSPKFYQKLPCKFSARKCSNNFYVHCAFLNCSTISATSSISQRGKKADPKLDQGRFI